MKNIPAYFYNSGYLFITAKSPFSSRTLVIITLSLSQNHNGIVDDDLWKRIKPFLPSEKTKVGRPRANLWNNFNDIIYVLTTGYS